MVSYSHQRWMSKYQSFNVVFVCVLHVCMVEAYSQDNEWRPPSNYIHRGLPIGALLTYCCVKRLTWLLTDYRQAPTRRLLTSLALLDSFHARIRKYFIELFSDTLTLAANNATINSNPPRQSRNDEERWWISWGKTRLHVQRMLKTLSVCFFSSWILYS